MHFPVRQPTVVMSRLGQIIQHPKFPNKYQRQESYGDFLQVNPNATRQQRQDAVRRFFNMKQPSLDLIKK